MHNRKKLGGRASSPDHSEGGDHSEAGPIGGRASSPDHSEGSDHSEVADHSESPGHSEGGIYWRLLGTFLRIGAFTFGGGWAMISLIEREVVDRHRWIARDEFLDLLAVAQSLPGILAVNISVTVGDRLRGLRGSLVAALGTILPSFVIILAIAMFLTPDLIKDNAIVAAIFKGIRPCVVALIVAPVLTTARAARLGWATAWVPVAVALLVIAGANPIWLIMAGGLGGYLAATLRARRAARKGGPR